MGILHELQRLVAQVLLEHEGPRTHCRCAQGIGRDVRRVHGRIPAGQHGQQRALRPLQVERDLVVPVRRDVRDVEVPELAGVELHGLGGSPPDDVEGVLHIRGRERLAVVPLHTLVQLEGQALAVLAPVPAGGQVSDDRVRPIQRLHRIVLHEVVVGLHHGCHGGDGGFLVDGEAGRIPAVNDAQHAAVLRGIHV